MQMVMRHVVYDVAENSSTIACQTCVPIVKEDDMSNPPERRSKDGEESRWHDEAVFVHW